MNDGARAAKEDVPTVKCPACGKPVRYEPANPFRPFCSERCRTMDLGAWASESYRIPAEPQQVDGGLPQEEED